MARRRAPKAPPLSAQKAVLQSHHVSVGDAPWNELDVLAEWLLRMMSDAAAREPRPHGRPPKWKRNLEAVEYLRSVAPPVTLSAAPGSRCVTLLAEFLAKSAGHESRDTAAELAGTLIARLTEIGFKPFSTP